MTVSPQTDRRPSTVFYTSVSSPGIKLFLRFHSLYHLSMPVPFPAFYYYYGGIFRKKGWDKKKNKSGKYAKNELVSLVSLHL